MASKPAAPAAAAAAPAVPRRSGAAGPVGPTSIKIVLTQDLFDEIAKLIGPIAKAEALALKLDDQHMKKKLPLVGEKEVATATKLSIEKFQIAKVAMPLNDGYLDVQLSDIEAEVGSDVKAIGVSLGRVVVTAQVDISAKVTLSQAEGMISSAISDVKVNIDKFDVKIGTGFGGDILEHVIDLFERVVRGVIESSLAAPIQSSLKSGLDSVLGRNLDTSGGLQNVAYLFRVDHRDHPVITRRSGVELDIAIDAFVNESGAKDGVVAKDAFPGLL
ncbi:hypothetical protein HK405_012230 [Cladochytrium tenue]|nr:hypothetical protein HK405_012230 [Cladochytrium tenue]